MPNEGIADIFLEIADLLDLEGVKFKPEAYRRAARTLLQTPEGVKDLVKSGRIDEVPGVGEALAKKVREFVADGKVHYLDELRQKWPSGLLELMRLEGIGPKTTRRFYLEFQVTGPEDLVRLLREGRLKGVFGFGDRKIELLEKALARWTAGPGGRGGERRTPLPLAQERVDHLLSALRATNAPVERLVFAGSLRRRRETVGDLDLLATSSSPKEVMERFVHLDEVEEVRLSGETKSTVVLREGLQVDLRVVAPEAFGAALQYFTGSKDHNVHLRSLANKKGFSLNEYGLTREERLVPAGTEEEVYAAVGLPWIPPEMREDQGEIEAAASGSLPSVVRDSDLLGELHIHVSVSVEQEDLLPWIEALQELHLRYAGFIVRATELGAREGGIASLRERLPRALKGVRVLLGVELPWGPDGWPRAVPGADFLLVRPPERRLAATEEQVRALIGEPPEAPTILGHLDPELMATGGPAWKDLLARPDLPAGLEVAVAHDRVVSETSRVREAAKVGMRVVLSGWPRIPEELPRLWLAAGAARRGWTTRASVVNAQEDPLRSLAAPVRALSTLGPPRTGREAPPHPSRKRPRRS